jgi:hypothetical protein
MRVSGNSTRLAPGRLRQCSSSILSIVCQQGLSNSSGARLFRGRWPMAASHFGAQCRAGKRLLVARRAPGLSRPRVRVGGGSHADLLPGDARGVEAAGFSAAMPICRPTPSQSRRSSWTRCGRVSNHRAKTSFDIVSEVCGHPAAPRRTGAHSTSFSRIAASVDPDQTILPRTGLMLAKTGRVFS